ncbi:hypothetical protein [Pseudoalteromonas sp. SMS1]|nr:hypothetical protein [Pseudoalteromonas sp. SMS1]
MKWNLFKSHQLSGLHGNTSDYMQATSLDCAVSPVQGWFECG